MIDGIVNQVDGHEMEVMEMCRIDLMVTGI